MLISAASFVAGVFVGTIFVRNGLEVSGISAVSASADLPSWTRIFWDDLGGIFACFLLGCSVFGQYLAPFVVGYEGFAQAASLSYLLSNADGIRVWRILLLFFVRNVALIPSILIVSAAAMVSGRALFLLTFPRRGHSVTRPLGGQYFLRALIVALVMIFASFAETALFPLIF